MTRRTAYLLALVAACGVTPSCNLFGQEVAEPLLEVPSVEENAAVTEALPTTDIEVEADNALWTPMLFTGSGDTLTEFLNRGQVYSEIDFLALSISSKSFQADNDYIVTPRFQLGWESESGFGIRGRYWNYKNPADSDWTYYPDRKLNPGQIPSDIAVSNETFPGELVFANSLSGFDFDVENYDFDLYQQFTNDHSAFLIGTGLRSASRESTSFSTRTINHTPNNPEYSLFYTEVRRQLEMDSESGLGVSAFSEYQRSLLKRNKYEVGLIAGVRTSYIPSKYDFAIVDAEVHYLAQEVIENNFSQSGSDINDDLWISEGNIGLELLKRYRRLTVRLRCQFETQYWNSSVTDNLTFTGLSTSFGLDW